MRDWDDGGVEPGLGGVGDPALREADELPLPEYRHRLFIAEDHAHLRHSPPRP